MEKYYTYKIAEIDKFISTLLHAMGQEVKGWGVRV